MVALAPVASALPLLLLAALYDHFKQRMDPRVSMSSQNPSGPAVKVVFDMAVHKLLEFDQMSGVAHWSVYFRLFWNDERLAFNGTDVFGPAWKPDDSVPLQESETWKPDAVPLDGFMDLQSHGCHVYDEAFLRRNGYNVLWSRPGRVEVPCDTRMADFPFDTQYCTFSVTPWSDRRHSFRAKHEGARPDAFGGSLNSEEWRVGSISMASVTRSFLDGVYPTVDYSMEFRRFPHYYLVNAVLPMALVVILSTLTMWLPIEGGSGERLGFSVTLLLTIMATALFTAEIRPATHDDTWLDKFQACCICLTFFPVMESVLVVWLQSIFEKVGARGGHELSSDGEESEEEGEEGRERENMPRGGRLGGRPQLRRQASSSGLGRITQAVQSNSVTRAAKLSMQPTFRLKLVVLCLRMIPTLRCLITGRRTGSVTPRSIDVMCRYANCMCAGSAAVLMVRLIPESAMDGFSVHLLHSPIYTAVALYVFVGIVGAFFLLLRISMYCSERSRLARPKSQDRFGLPLRMGVPEATGDDSHPSERAGVLKPQLQPPCGESTPPGDVGGDSLSQASLELPEQPPCQESTPPGDVGGASGDPLRTRAL